MAEDAGVDLVEIAPLAQPPVCRIMDYGKFKYAEAKKAHEAKLKQKQIQVKEVKFRPGTDEGDYQIKLRNLVRFLQEGDGGPGVRCASAGEGKSRPGALWHGRAVSQDGRTPIDHGAGANQEAVEALSFAPCRRKAARTGQQVHTSGCGL